MQEVETAIVTGAGAGLGRAIVEGLARSGVKVAAIDISEADLADVAAAVKDHPGELLPLPADVSDAGAVNAAFDDAAAAFGRIDAALNNAGIIAAKPFLEVTPELWHRIMAVNAGGVFFATQAAARHMVLQEQRGQYGLRGRICNVTSGGASGRSELTAVYGASKAAVSRVTKGAVTAFYQPYQICVFAVSPTATSTRMWDVVDEQANEATDAPEGAFREGRSRSEVGGRMATPAEAAEAVIWALHASPDAVNGRVVYTGPVVLADY